MSAPRNPYAPPVASVADPIDPVNPDIDGTLIPNGQRVSPRTGARWIGDAWLLFTARPGKWLLTFLLFIGLFSCVDVAASWVPFADVLHSALMPFLMAGVVMAADRQRRTGTFDLSAAFSGFRKPGPLLAIGAVKLVSVGALYLACARLIGVDFANRFVLKMSTAAQLHWSDLGLALLLGVAIVLPVTAATWLAPPLVTLHGIRAGSAMKMSLIGSLKNVMPVIVYGVCGTLFVLLSVIPLGLGLLVSIPVMIITPYTVYRGVFVDPR